MYVKLCVIKNSYLLITLIEETVSFLKINSLNYLIYFYKKSLWNVKITINSLLCDKKICNEFFKYYYNNSMLMLLKLIKIIVDI